MESKFQKRLREYKPNPDSKFQKRLKELLASQPVDNEDVKKDQQNKN